MASCFCAKSAAKGQFVKLVFPGGHVELLDRPVLAAEIMMQHPRFCVARPNVFRDPAGAVAAPDAVLAPGRKYYVVPRSTVRRLQKYSCSPGRHGSPSSSSANAESLPLRRQASPGHDAAGDKGGKKWFNCLVSNGSKAERPGGIGYSSSKLEVARREVDVKESKENGNAGGGGSPGPRRRRAAASPGASSYSWQPSLHSITEE